MSSSSRSDLSPIGSVRAAMRQAFSRAIVTPARLKSDVHVGSSFTAFGKPLIYAVPGASIHIGQQVTLDSSSRHQVLGVDHPVILRAVRSGATITLGDGTGMSGGSIIAALHVSIGNECLLGANVIVTDTHFHPLSPAGRRYASLPEPRDSDRVVIGDNVFIGTRAIVLAGASIGANSVIGAGSVVTRAIPPNVIAAGNPARVIREIS